MLSKFNKINYRLQSTQSALSIAHLSLLFELPATSVTICCLLRNIFKSYTPIRCTLSTHSISICLSVSFCQFASCLFFFLD